MSNSGGFIVLHRKILDWEWSRDANTLCLFVHLLLLANYEECRFEGKVISRGQLVTSLPSLAAETGLTIRQTRTALAHLISTGEVTNNSYTKYRVITITNYDKYQDNRQTNRQTNDSQSTDKVTDNRQQYNNITNINKETNISSSSRKSMAFVPPTAEDIEKFCDERGVWLIDPQRFVDYYESTGWIMKNGQKMKNWKAAVRRWEARERDRQSEATDDDIPW